MISSANLAPTKRARYAGSVKILAEARPTRSLVAAHGRALGIDRFCVAICHDLRGPVATAGAALDRLARIAQLAHPNRSHVHATALDDEPLRTRLPDGEPGTLIEIAQGSLARAEEMLAALPGLLAAEPGCAPTAVSLDEVLRGACDDVALELRLVGGRIRAAGPMPAVVADRERLRVALRNLLRNAIAHRRSVPLEVEIASEHRDRHATLLISDNGIGIPRAERARIFAPLYRGRGAGPGSGLGLALARHAIEACGGRLALRPRRGAGARFAITLRVAESGA